MFTVCYDSLMVAFLAALCAFPLLASCADVPQPEVGGADGVGGGVGLHPPTAPQITISPAEPVGGELLRAQALVDATDPDGDPIWYRYAWEGNGEPRPDLTGSTVPAGVTAPAETWIVRVWATDGEHEGPTDSASALIGVNIEGTRPPTPPVIHLEPAQPVAGNPILLIIDTPAADADGDVLSQSIVWEENGSHRVELDDLAVVPGSLVAWGASWRVVVSVTDGVHDAVVTEAVVTLGSGAVSISGATIYPADPMDDDDLTCSAPSQIPSGLPATFTWTWTRDGIVASDVGSSVDVRAEATQAGEEWICDVSVTDGYTSASATTAPVTIREQEVIAGRVTSRFDFTVLTDPTSGDQSLSGTAEWNIDAINGPWLVAECDIVWTLSDATSSSSCPSCTYAFDAEFVVDLSASDLGTGCERLSVDSAGDIRFYSDTQYFIGVLDDPSYLYYRYPSYYSGISLAVSGDRTWSRSARGVRRGYTDSVSEGTDASGDPTLSVYHTAYYEYY